MLSHDLKQTAGAVRLMQEVPAADLRASLSSIAELLDHAADEASYLEGGWRKAAAPPNRLTEAVSNFCQLSVRAASAVVRKTA
jgi:hypothetical protein